MELVDVLASSPGLRWFVGRVVRKDHNGTLTIFYAGAEVSWVSYVDQVEPAPGDVVHGVMLDNVGFLVLGTNNKADAPPAPTDASAVPTIFPAFHPATATPTGWVPNVLLQSPTSRACWFYVPLAWPRGTAVDKRTLLGPVIASVEIEVTRLSGGPPEFFAHATGQPGAALEVVDERFVNGLPTVGVPTWVSLPVAWGEWFIQDKVLGFGIGGGAYSGEYSGTGRLRITPLLTGR